MAYTGKIRFIAETDKVAIVDCEPRDGYDVESPYEYRIIRADFSEKERDDVVAYTYKDLENQTDGRDVTLS